MDAESPSKRSDSGVETDIDFSATHPSGDGTQSDVVVDSTMDISPTHSMADQPNERVTDHVLDAIPDIQVFHESPPPTVAFHQQIQFLQNQVDHLKGMLDQRESVVTLQTREMAVLEQEKCAARKDMEQSRREKETAVVKYAMAEKSLIDLRHGNEQLAKKLKDTGKESEALAARVKFVTNERDRANKELRKTTTECEAQKQDIFNLETKLKWSHAKIKEEMGCRTSMETRISELTTDVATLRESQQQNKTQLHYVKKEIEAELILLKHTVASKEKENSALLACLAQSTSELEELARKHAILAEEHMQLQSVNTKQNAAIVDFEKTHEELSNLFANYSQELASSQSSVAALQTELDASVAALDEMKALQANYEDQSLDVTRMQAKDAELMLFVKELTEKSVDVENRLLLERAKAAALQLENDKIRDLFEEHRQLVVRLEHDLKLCVEERAIDSQQMETLVQAATAERAQMEVRLDNCLGELDTAKRKHSQVVRELTRDIAVLKTKLEPKRVVEGRVEDQGPTKKSLIDRIAKLQRILAKQTEKIEFLENHSAGLTNQLKFKTH